MPVLTAWTPMSSTTLRYWARTASTGSSQAPCTPREFCAVTAVTHAHAVHAEREHRLQVGLDAGAAAGVGAGDGEHPGAVPAGQRLRRPPGPPKWSQPPLLVQGAPSTVTWGRPDGSSTSPITFQRAGSFTSGGKVATIAWSSPPVSTHCIGSTPTACPMSFIWVGMSIAPERRSMRTLLASAMCPRSAISPSLTSRHRGRAEPGGRRARVVRRLGAPVRLDEGARASGSRGRAPRTRRRTSPASR